MPKGLTPKQAAFCEEYLIDLNATQAAIRAGYSGKTARSQAQRMLTNVDIKNEVLRLMGNRSDEVTVTAAQVLKEFVALAFYDIRKIAAVSINCPADIAKLPDELGKCIAGWTWDRQGNFVIKLVSRPQMLELIARHLAMFPNRLEHTGKDGGPIQSAPALSQEMEKEISDCMAEIRANLIVPEGLKPLGS